MSYGDSLVGGIALVLAVVAAAVALGPWQVPFQLRSVRAVDERFGRTAARTMVMLVAAMCFVASVSILNGIRPSYATPQSQRSPVNRY
ncbi:hypothetical protein [Crateriforma conspicua]|uniref:Uncharacterized protein n=1 Tax=Crateriforma conspicua TaxID=2527996 RepID=A0A5C5Y8H0_9PLAN|nr:hypothetical protein [Crateriforma conspicua]QDV65337.1 hypothetical protein Mal65_45070 [Crateriforma conspicua]TWT70731.1 hypothetical protein Pan14r_30380 [Crateriforma conspicua]